MPTHKHSELLSQNNNQLLHIVSNHYPERLGLLLIINAPWLFSAFWRLVSPFLTPATVRKVIFVSGAEVATTLLQHIEKEILETEYGGENVYKYNHEEYMAMLLKEEETWLKA